MIDDVSLIRSCLSIVNVDMSWEDVRIISSFAYEKIVINKFHPYYLYNTTLELFYIRFGNSVTSIEQCFSVVSAKVNKKTV